MSTERRLSREEEERLWMISVVPFIPVFIGVIVYLIHLRSIDMISSNTTFVLCIFLVLFPIFAAVCAVTYEIASSFKIKRTLSFRVKRFLSRMAFILGYALLFAAFWYLFQFSLSWLLPDKYILLLTLVITSLIIALLASFSKTRAFLSRLSKEDSAP